MTTEAAGSGSAQGGFLHPSKVAVSKGAGGTIGLWAGYDFQKNPLELAASSPGIIAWRESPFIFPNDRIIHIVGSSVGSTILNAREQFNPTAVWCYIQVDVALASTSGDGHKYTDSPNEYVVRRTTPTMDSVISMLFEEWPELTENGARTLTAQSMAETGEWQNCWNWNLGNVKSGDRQPHIYLHDVWECDSRPHAEAEVQRAGGLASIATDEQIAKHGWKCPSAVIVYQPPHAQSRFRAYFTLLEGAQRWIEHHKAIARDNPDYLPAVNRGDIAVVAHILKQVRYYSAGEDAYNQLMTDKKRKVDKAMGPL